MFKCGNLSFNIAENTILSKMIESSGKFDVSSNELPESFIGGVMMYLGQKQVTCGSDMLEFLDFLLFAEIPIDGVVDFISVIEILQLDANWQCQRANITTYLIDGLLDRIGGDDDEIRYENVLEEWLDRGAICHEHIDTLKRINVSIDHHVSNRVRIIVEAGCRMGELNMFSNLTRLEMHYVYIETLSLDLQLPKLISFKAKHLIVSEITPLRTSSFPMMKNLELFDIECDSRISSRFVGTTVLYVCGTPNLKTLSLRTNGPIAIEIVGEFENLADLYIDSAACKFNPDSFVAPKLRKLGLDHDFPALWGCAPAGRLASSNIHTAIATVPGLSGVTDITFGHRYPYSRNRESGRLCTASCLDTCAHLPITRFTLNDTICMYRVTMTNLSNLAYLHLTCCDRTRSGGKMPRKIKIELYVPLVENLLINCYEYIITITGTTSVKICDVWLDDVADLKFASNADKLTLRDPLDQVNPNNLIGVKKLILLSPTNQPLPISTICWNYTPEKYPFLSRFQENCSGTTSTTACRLIPQCTHKFYKQIVDDYIHDYRMLRERAIEFMQITRSAMNTCALAGEGTKIDHLETMKTYYDDKPEDQKLIRAKLRAMETLIEHGDKFMSKESTDMLACHKDLKVVCKLLHSHIRMLDVHEDIIFMFERYFGKYYS